MPKNLGALLIEIEILRAKMHQLANQKGFLDEEVISISQQLDVLLNKYTQEKLATRNNYNNIQKP